MKKIFLSLPAMLIACATIAQKYPEPEFSNEIYLLKKDSVASLVRLEKGNSKMASKVKMGGLGGAESGYTLEGEKSTVRLSSGKNLSFIFTTGGSHGGSSAKTDSMMRAGGVDPSMMSSMSDPANMITLYKTDISKGNRKIYMQKSGGMFGPKKNMSSDKYTFSPKKIKEGYWELIVDKPLPKGEYSFTMMGFGMGNMDGSLSLFAFAVD